MAYILRLIYEDQTEELVPVWSPALDKEVEILFKNNPSLALYEVVSDEPTEDECKYIDERVVKTNYMLPKEYRINRKRRTK